MSEIKKGRDRRPFSLINIMLSYSIPMFLQFSGFQGENKKSGQGVMCR